VNISRDEFCNPRPLPLSCKDKIARRNKSGGQQGQLGQGRTRHRAGQYPDASFTLYRPPAAETEDDYRLGVFELPDPSAEDPSTDSSKDLSKDSWPGEK
jgi:hypothetical protein